MRISSFVLTAFTLLGLTVQAASHDPLDLSFGKAGELDYESAGFATFSGDSSRLDLVVDVKLDAQNRTFLLLKSERSVPQSQFYTMVLVRLKP